MVEVLWIVAGAVYLLPALVNLRYYFLVRSINYFYFSAFFILVIINLLSLAFESQGAVYEILNIVTYGGNSYCLVKIATGTIASKYNNYYRSTIYFIFFYIISISLAIIIVNFTVGESTVLNLINIILGEAMRIVVSAIIVYRFFKLRPVLDNQRTTVLRYLWIFLGVAYLSIGIIRILLYGYGAATLLFQGPDVFQQLNLDSLGPQVLFAGVAALGITVFVIALAFPESMLVSHSQIILASRLYGIMDEHAIVNSKKWYNSLPRTNYLMSYIQSLPRDLFEDEKSSK